MITVHARTVRMDGILPIIIPAYHVPQALMRIMVTAGSALKEPIKMKKHKMNAKLVLRACTSQLQALTAGYRAFPARLGAGARQEVVNVTHARKDMLQ